MKLKCFYVSLAISFAIGSNTTFAAGSLNSVNATDHHKVVAMVRTLHLLQDQIASGSKEALSAQKGLIVSIESVLTSMEASVWDDRSNILSVVSFCLSGGSPASLKRINSVISAGNNSKILVLSVLSYLEGRKIDALKYFSKLNVNEYNAGLRAQLNFMNASLIVGKEPLRAMSLLDLVRADVPGTLLEEAALRRQLLISREIGNFEKFVSIANEYIRRFEKSVYSGNFRQRLGVALLHFDFSDSPDKFQKISDLLGGLDVSAQSELYLSSARQLITEGRIKQALPLAEKALALSQEKSDFARASLYIGAIKAVSAPTIHDGLVTLNSIDRKNLTGDDVKLLDHATYVGNSIIKSAGIANLNVNRSKNILDIPDKKENDSTDLTLSRATKAISNIDQMLIR